MENKNKNLKETTIKIEDIKFEDIPEVEEIITPSNGSYNCCT